MYGYAKDVDGNLKPILLNNIRNISYINNENIYIEYIGASSQAEGNVLITLSTNSSQIQPAVERWLRHNTSGSGGSNKVLNDYLGSVSVVQVINAGSNSTSCTYQAASDLSAACAIGTPSSSGNLNVGAAYGNPTVGALLFKGSAQTDLVEDGNYRVSATGDYFVTITNGVISYVEVCPINVEVVFGPNEWDARRNGMMSYTGCYLTSMGGSSATSQWYNHAGGNQQGWIGLVGLDKSNTTAPNVACPRNYLGGATLYYSNVGPTGPWYKWYAWNGGSPYPLGSSSMSNPYNGSSMNTDNISIPAFQVTVGAVNYTYPRSQMSSNNYFCGGTNQIYADSAAGANQGKIVDSGSTNGCGLSNQNTCVFPCP